MGNGLNYICIVEGILWQKAVLYSFRKNQYTVFEIRALWQKNTFPQIFDVFNKQLTTLNGVDDTLVNILYLEGLYVTKGDCPGI